MNKQKLTLLPADPILGINEEFKADKKQKKINLTAGVYIGDDGQYYKFDTVKEAEQCKQKIGRSNFYLPVLGEKSFLDKAIQHVLPDNKEPLSSACTLGGTGGLSLISKFLFSFNADSTIWLTNPTWANHNAILNIHHLKTDVFNWSKNNQLQIDDIIDAIDTKMKPDDWIVLHANCHNPTGIDPSKEQWKLILDKLLEKKINVLFDIAYHGLALSLEEDIAHVRAYFHRFKNAAISYSFSKNFGLYNDRTGVVIVHSQDTKKEIIASHLSQIQRATISSPPAHGSWIVDYILGNQETYEKWQIELSEVRNRINAVRALLSKALSPRFPQFAEIEKQKGMFFMSELTLDQIEKLKNQFGIYVLKNGRMNICAINSNNFEYFCDALRSL